MTENDRLDLKRVLIPMSVGELIGFLVDYKLLMRDADEEEHIQSVQDSIEMIQDELTSRLASGFRREILRPSPKAKSVKGLIKP